MFAARPALIAGPAGGDGNWGWDGAGARHLTQGSLDGVTAAIRVGPVTELDLMWRFAMADDRPGVVELVADAGRGERRDRRPGCGRVMPWVVPRPAELLDRDLVTELAATGARTALLQVLERVT